MIEGSKAKSLLNNCFLYQNLKVNKNYMNGGPNNKKGMNCERKYIL